MGASGGRYRTTEPAGEAIGHTLKPSVMMKRADEDIGPYADMSQVSYLVSGSGARGTRSRCEPPLCGPGGLGFLVGEDRGLEAYVQILFLGSLRAVLAGGKRYRTTEPAGETSSFLCEE